jgi:hypothetical protein
MANGSKINRTACRDFALRYARDNRLGWMPERVSARFLDDVEAFVTVRIQKAIEKHRTVGKTIIDFFWGFSNDTQIRTNQRRTGRPLRGPGPQIQNGNRRPNGLDRGPRLGPGLGPKESGETRSLIESSPASCRQTELTANMARPIGRAFFMRTGRASSPRTGGPGRPGPIGSTRARTSQRPSWGLRSNIFFGP